MGWYIDLLEVMFDRELGTLSLVFLWIFGFIANAIVPAFTRYVDNWEYGMEPKNLPEAMAWAVACALFPFAVFAVGAGLFLAAVITSPVWWPFYSVIKRHRRAAVPTAPQVDDPERQAAQDEIEALERRAARPTQAAGSRS